MILIEKKLLQALIFVLLLSSVMLRAQRVEYYRHYRDILLNRSIPPFEAALDSFYRVTFEPDNNSFHSIEFFSADSILLKKHLFDYDNEGELIGEKVFQGDSLLLYQRLFQENEYQKKYQAILRRLAFYPLERRIETLIYYNQDSLPDSVIFYSSSREILGKIIYTYNSKGEKREELWIKGGEELFYHYQFSYDSNRKVFILVELDARGREKGRVELKGAF